MGQNRREAARRRVKKSLTFQGQVSDTVRLGILLALSGA